MIRIGDFSRLSRVSVKTLRYYDELGLIKPAHVDQFTGYRYYSEDQFIRLNRVLALRDLGFSLEQIGQLVDTGLSGDEVRGMLLLRRSEIEGRVAAEAGRLARIEAWLSQLAREDVMSEYDVVIKRVEAMKVASLRGVVPTPPEQGLLWCRLEDYLKEHGIRPSGPCLTLYYDEEQKEQDWDIEVCEPIAEDISGSADVKVQVLPALETLACTVHHGSFVTIGEAYRALEDWVRANGYSIAGPLREVYLRDATPEADPERRESGIYASQTDPGTITEVQFPVSKVGARPDRA
jgi:DNA-binding transcriptional MerR regulator